MNRKSISTPQSTYKELFKHVQLSGIFDDSKIFTDSTAKMPSDEILSQYAKKISSKDFCLKDFISEHFTLPHYEQNKQGIPTDDVSHKTANDAINTIWERLERNPNQASTDISLLALPFPYIVPGGRFNEFFYWDSYFTMLGLLEHGRLESAKNLLKNFAFLIEKYGFIPNGTRSYFLSRSQTPYFSLMLELISEHCNDGDLYVTFLPALLKEYSYWMQGKDECISPNSHDKHVVNIKGFMLNRYWDFENAPREESYKEDVELQEKNPQAANLMRDIRSAAESGWDFSSRWCQQADALESINTTQIVPIDLNCMLAHLELSISKAYDLIKDKRSSQLYKQRFDKRVLAIKTLFFNEECGHFCDINLSGDTHQSLNGACIYPLYFGFATGEQAKQTEAAIKNHLLRPGGWLTSTVYSGEQWDAPNGWAPLQWLTFKGLQRYGFNQHAEKGATNWVNNVLRTFEKTGQFMEKYNVEDTEALASGGEYIVQDGFGWTNGVYSKLLKELNIL